MQHPYEILKPGYEADLARMQITRLEAVRATANRLCAFVRAGRYKRVSDELAIPQVVIATSFERESGSNFRCNPAQGDPIDRPSIHVPKGLGPYNRFQDPFENWNDAAIVAYKIDHWDRVGAGNWDWPLSMYEWEVFNGFGPRNHGRVSGYLEAGTNIYTGGKYVADGVWSPDAIDQQLGCLPVAYMMAQIMPELGLPGWPEASDQAPEPPPPVVGIGAHPDTGEESTVELQAGLIKLGYDLGRFGADGNYGRLTFAAVRQYEADRSLTVDRGYAGPEVWGQLKEDLARQV